MSQNTVKKKARLNQILAVERGVRSSAYKELTKIHQVSGKPVLFEGFSRRYQPVNDEGVKLPDETQKVQHNFQALLNGFAFNATAIWDVTARKDWTNTEATGDVIVDGKTLLSDVPVPFLLFMEKQLGDVRTFVRGLPTLDPSETWTFDDKSGLQKSDEVITNRTVKEQEPITLAVATVQHPAQAELITKQVVEGTWTSIKESGSIPLMEQASILGRVEKLLQAVKVAREEANSVEEIPSPNVGATLFGYLFASDLPFNDDQAQS